MRVEVYLQSELVAIASVNRDGSFAIEGFPRGKRIAAGAAPDGATAEERIAGLMAIQNYPYCWCERVDDRGIMSKMTRRPLEPLGNPRRPTLPDPGPVPALHQSNARATRIRAARGRVE